MEYRFRERENGEVWEIQADSESGAWAKLGEEYIYALELQRRVRRKDREGYARENFDFMPS